MWARGAVFDSSPDLRKLHPETEISVPDQPSLLSLLTITQVTESGNHSKSTWLISILSPARTRWDLFIMIMAFWNCFYVPFEVAFSPQKELLALTVLDIFIDFAYLCDILVYARSTYLDLTTGEEVADPRRIVVNYVTSGRLWVDLLSAIPWDIFALITDSNAELQLFTFSKIVRLLRFSKILMFMQVKSNIKLTLKLIHLLFLVLVYLHLVACLWFLLSSSSAKYTPPSLYLMHEPELYSSSIWRQYAFSLYMSVYMLTGAELGPRTEWERIFMGFAVIVGQLFQAFIFGEIAVVLFDLSQSTRRLAAIQGAVATTMVNMRLDSDLRSKISAFLISMQGSVTKQTEYEELFSLLPPSLKQDIRSFQFESVMLKNPLLKKYRQISASILHRLSTLYCQPEQNIITQGEAADSLFFIASGKCEVEVFDEHNSPHFVKFLLRGCFFGEIGLLFSTLRTATVRAVTYSTLAVINRADFDFVCSKFPKARRILKDNALKYTDIRKEFLIGMIKRCPFLEQVSDRGLSEVLYGLPVKIFEENSFLYKDGKECEFVGFILEGKVEVYTYLNESKWTSAPIIASYNPNQIFIRRHKGIRRTSIDYLHKRPHNLSIVKMSLDELGPGSVLCSNSILLKEPAKFFVKATELTVVLALSPDFFVNLMNCNSEIHSVVCTYRAKISARNRWAQTRRAHWLSLDYEKKLPAEASAALYKTRMIVKRAIMMKILGKRKQRAKGLELHTMVTKLKAILEADKTRDARMMEKIRRGVALEGRYLIDAYEMLEITEVENPLLAQFATSAAKISSLVLQTKAKVIQGKCGLDAIRIDLSKSQSEIKSIKELMLLVTRLANLVLS